MTYSLALEIARDAHATQLDKLGEPYINHPIAVSGLLKDVPTFLACSSAQQEILLQVAILHDVIEDTSVTAEELISAGIKEEVVALVKVLSHGEHETREDYIDRVSGNPLARIVKTADIAHNSSKSRLDLLPRRVRNRLIRKYRKDLLSILREHPDDAEWLANSGSVLKAR